MSRKNNILKRRLERVLFHLVKLICRVLALVSHRLYMKLYLRLLKGYGLGVNGVPRYISPSVYFDDLDRISMGDRVVVSSYVSFLTHDYSITTALRSIGHEVGPDIASVRGIHIGDNVFIGRGALIMPNVKIGDNVIVGAGSVVRGSIPSGSIVSGNPATVTGDICAFAASWVKRLESDQVRVD